MPLGPWATRLGERRSVLAALVLATLFAAALRLPFLGHQSLWFDEIYTRDILGERTLSGLWHHVKATESTPPLYYLLAWLVNARSATAMRLIPALALIASVPVGYLAFRRLIGERAALATAVIVAVDPILVSYATDARSYGLLVLTALLSVWAMSVVLENGSRRAFAGWVIASAACVWTHYFGAFLVVGEFIVLLVALPRARRTTIGWTLLTVLLLVPLVPLVASQSGDERAASIAGISLGSRLVSAVRQFAMGPNVPRTWLEAAGLALLCVAVGVGVILAVRSGRGPRIVLALAAFAFGAPLLMGALGIEDRFYVRNVIAAAPLAAALAAPALLRLRAAPLVAYALLATLTAVWVATNWRYEQADWGGALAQAEAIDSRAAVVTVAGFSVPVVRTYLDRQPAAGQGVLAQRAWIVMAPVRGPGHRALGPVPAPGLPGFTTVRPLQVHAFRLVLVDAAAPTRILATDVPGATVFPGRG